LACYLDAPVNGGSSGSLATLLGALGPEIDVTVLGTAPDVVERVGAARPGAAMHVLTPVRNKGDARAIAEHVRMLRRLRPDVLHANLDHQWSGQYGMLAGVLSGTPVLAAVHAVWPHPHRLQQRLVHALARRVDAYVAVSKFAARTTEELLGLPVGAVHVIHNGVTPPPELAARPAMSAPVVGAVGRLSPEKGFDVLLRAMAKIPDAHLVLVGDGDERAELEALAEATGVTGRVTFAGWVDPPWAQHWSFDVLVVPSRNESFGLVLLEAMHAGIPAVAAAVGGIPELIVDGENGLLVPPQDPDALADAVHGLLADAERRAAMTARARVTAAAFTPAAMAARFTGLYGEIARRRA
jgi:glycosyltransferase involved in cell wall biosynthesis